MLYKKIKIDIFDWDIHLIVCENDKKDFIDAFKIIKKNNIIIRDSYPEFLEYLEDLKNMENGGSHWYNSDERISLIFLIQHSNIKSIINTLTHEIDHVVFHIEKHLSLNCKETRAFINSYINSNLLYDILNSNLKIMNSNG